MRFEICLFGPLLQTHCHTCVVCITTNKKSMGALHLFLHHKRKTHKPQKKNKKNLIHAQHLLLVAVVVEHVLEWLLTAYPKNKPETRKNLTKSDMGKELSYMIYATYM